MRVLGIETATAVCGAAIVDDGKVLVEKSVEALHIHSEKLISLIDECFRSTQSNLQLHDGIAISIGPGSFTGLRIGLSVAKGLSYAGGKPLIRVPTLEALAWRAIQQGLVEPDDVLFPMIDARRDEVYTSVFQCGGTPHVVEVLSARAASVDECQKLVEGRKRIIVLGDGAEKFKQYLQKVGRYAPDRYIIPPRDERICSAAAVAALGGAKLARGEQSDVAELEPMYVKDFYTLVKTQHPQVKA